MKQEEVIKLIGKGYGKIKVHEMNKLVKNPLKLITTIIDNEPKLEYVSIESFDTAIEKWNKRREKMYKTCRSCGFSHRCSKDDKRK